MKKILIFLTFLCVNIAITPLNMLHNTCINWSILVGFVLNFALIVMFTRKLKEQGKKTNILLLSMLGASVVFLPFHIIHFKETMGSLLGNTTDLIAIFAGYVFSNIETTKRKYIYYIILVVFIILTSTWVSNLWDEFSLNFMN